MAPVIDTTREALLERRSEILESLGLDEGALAELSAGSTLSGEEWEAKEELEAIAFLLGEDGPSTAA